MAVKVNFQNGGRRHLNLLPVSIFFIWTFLDSGWLCSCKISWIYLIRRLSYWGLSTNSKWRLSAILNYFWLPGPPTKSSCWPEVCVQILCRSDLYFRRYLRWNISQVWLKTPIHAPKIYVLGGFWPLNVTFHHLDPQKALPWRKTRAVSHRASKSVQRCGQDAVRRIHKQKTYKG